MHQKKIERPIGAERSEKKIYAEPTQEQMKIYGCPAMSFQPFKFNLYTLLLKSQGKPHDAPSHTQTSVASSSCYKEHVTDSSSEIKYLYNCSGGSSKLFE